MVFMGLGQVRNNSKCLEVCKTQASYLIFFFNFSNPDVFIQCIQSIKYQSKHDSLLNIMLFRATCFDSFESSSGTQGTDPRLSMFIVHSGIPNA